MDSGHPPTRVLLLKTVVDMQSCTAAMLLSTCVSLIFVGSSAVLQLPAAVVCGSVGWACMCTGCTEEVEAIVDLEVERRC